MEVGGSGGFKRRQAGQDLTSFLINLKKNLLQKRKMEVQHERPIRERERERERQKELTTLRKKNIELQTVTRRLEEKVKTLEQVTNQFKQYLYLKRIKKKHEKNMNTF